MSIYSALILLVWSFMSISATASPQNVGNTTLYGPGQLDSQVSRAFLDCLSNTGIEYNIYVDEDGITVVVPTVNRDVDFDSEDRELLKCIMDVNHRMKSGCRSERVLPMRTRECGSQQVHHA